MPQDTKVFCNIKIYFYICLLFIMILNNKMNIKQNTEYIMSHPYTKKAIEEYNKGNTRMLEQLIFEIHFHTFDKTALLCSKVFGLNKWNNSCAIKGIIRNVEPPENLSISLQIPKK